VTQSGQRRGRILAAATVFAAGMPGSPGPRIWNDQLIRYAGYRIGDKVVGDPANVALTDAIVALGWTPPARRGRFDVLPLVIEDASGPRYFDLPADTVLEVDITHPDLPWFADLGLRWHAVPVISNMPLLIGGLTYEGNCFSGWYVDFEVLRNLGDQDRYDQLPIIAQHLGLDTHRDSIRWRARAAVELLEALHHSYRQAGVTLADSQTAAHQHVAFEEAEKRAGRRVSAVREWIVPPVLANVAPTWAREYTDLNLRPNYVRRETLPWQPA
jgi:nitric-oxide synthase